MPSLVRRIRKNMLKREGFHREGPTRWAIDAGGKPYLKQLTRGERRILNKDGVPVGMHYPR